MAPLQHGSHRFAAFQSLLAQVHAYMSQLLYVQRSDGDTVGTSWIELFADFELIGHKHELTKQGLNEQVAATSQDSDTQRSVTRWRLWQHRNKRRALKRLPAKATVARSIRADLEYFKRTFRFFNFSHGR